MTRGAVGDSLSESITTLGNGKGGVGDSLLLMAVRVYDSLELEVMDPKDDQGDVEQEDGKS